ncbi:N-acetyltransferase [uncultured Campylobacter sp.]|uniref:GNAT family N-acetyltransferase n=2 Tax=uncultured Campylobacter sp. TaxID=218934 RepID=UPI002636C9EE|nr:GNAT family N-acetyltransferase [uncultured Campylobacter sp.]
MRLERIGEDSALIARIEAINVAAFPEIERISIKNFLKMSRKGQLEIAAIFEDFSALGGGAANKHRAAASENLCAPKQDFCAAKRDCGEASQNRGSAGKNSDADNRGAAELASLSSENRGAADKNSNATCEKSSLKSKNPGAASENLCALQDCSEASQNCGSAGNCATAAQNLSGEELVGFFVYRTEQTYKRAVSHHKQPPLRLNADKILRSKAHSSAEFESAGDEISSGKVKFSEAKFFSVASGKIAGQKTQPLGGDEILNASADSKIPIDADRLICGAGGKILSSARRDEILSSAAEGKISSGTAESEISRYDESEISSGGESGIFYVAYLGIDAKFRGLGIGSRLLALISEQNPRAQIVLDVEPPHEDAPNLAQRLRRIEFYGRHGFRRCGKFFNYAGLSFEILAKPPLSAPQQGFDVASFVKFIGAGNKFRFKITDAPLYKN